MRVVLLKAEGLAQRRNYLRHNVTEFQHYTSRKLTAEQPEKDGSILRIKMKNENIKGELLSLVSSSGRDIDSFQVCEPSLNDIFVQYTEAGI